MKINLFGEKNISIIIEDKKSLVAYSNQTNDYSCSHPEINGYHVPVEFDETITQKFLSYGYAGDGHGLDKCFYDDAPETMKQLCEYVWGNYIFELDENKLHKNTESWVFLVAEKNKSVRDCGIIQGFPDKINAVLTWPNSG